jgi:hypothetical protein
MSKQKVSPSLVRTQWPVAKEQGGVRMISLVSPCPKNCPALGVRTLCNPLVTFPICCLAINWQQLVSCHDMCLRPCLRELVVTPGCSWCFWRPCSRALCTLKCRKKVSWYRALPLLNTVVLKGRKEELSHVWLLSYHDSIEEGGFGNHYSASSTVYMTGRWQHLPILYVC